MKRLILIAVCLGLVVVCLIRFDPVAKDSPLRKQASRLAADEAVRFLSSIGYDGSLLPAIHHAIAARGA